MNKSLWTETQKKMITPEGNVYRYIGSEVIDAFEKGDCADISFPNGYNKGNRVFEGYSPCLNLSTYKNFIAKEDNMRIRKLTPKECFRLMGFDDEDFEKAEKVNSNAQLYKQARNSIVVDVLEEIFCMMLDDNGNIFV